ncbi:hypothetical protein FACS189481_1140 [Clostridia bacterium]|nr:hypothetical protein FACS189481_1140 [Clostridia bacterium]
MGLGTLFVSFGISLTLKSGRGMDTISVLAAGIHVVVNKFFSISFGTALITAQIFAFFVVAAWNFRELKIGSVISFLLVGQFVNFFGFLLKYVTTPNLAVSLCLLLFGIPFLGAGIGLGLAANLGATPLDLIPNLAAKTMNKKISLVRICADISYGVIGVILGGKASVGLGTILCMLFIGPCIGKTIWFCNKHFPWLAGHD